MALTKYVRDNITRYTFVEKVEFKNMRVIIYYDNGKTKKLSYRASAKHLIKIIDQIKEEIGFEEIKQQRDILVRKALKRDRENMPFLFGISTNNQK